MARNRSGYDSEHSNQFVSSAKKNPPAPVHLTPRRGQFAGTITNDLHRSPVAMRVSPSGERTISPIDTTSYINTFVNIKANDSTNPFASESNALDLGCKSDEETLLKFTEKKNGPSIKIRRKNKTKYHRKAAIMTVRGMTERQKDVQDASVQTESPMGVVNRPVEDIGDKRKPMKGCCSEVSLASKMEQHNLTLVNKNLESLDTMLLQFIPENIRMLTSFLIMIVLIFWLTSIILDVEIPSDFWRIAMSYVQSFKWNYFYEQPQTTTEKYWDYLTKLFN